MNDTELRLQLLELAVRIQRDRPTSKGIDQIAEELLVFVKAEKAA